MIFTSDMDGSMSYKGLLESIFKSIENASKNVEKMFQDLPTTVGDVRKDLDRIEDSLASFFRLLEEEKNKLLSQSQKISEEQIKKTKHNLRSQMGAVQSYSELILEELGNLDANHEIRSCVSLVAKAASDVLPFIAEIQTGQYHLDESSIIGLEENFSFYGLQYRDCSALIIDDSPYNREILDRRLKKYGLTVFQAETGKQGLEKAKEHAVDLILLDIIMPGLNGYQVLERLKDNPKTKDIPVLMISAVHEVASIVQCIQAGADDYLSIPFNPTILNARISACLDKKRLQDQQKQKTEELWKVKNTLQAAIESINEGFAIINKQGYIEVYNKKFADFYPVVRQHDVLRLNELLKYNIENGIYSHDTQTQSRAIPKAINDIDCVNLDELNWLSPEKHLIQLANGRWIEIKTNEIPDGYVMVHADVTEEKVSKEKLEYQALHDPLTGLPNRIAFKAALEEVYENEARVSSSKKKGFALLYLDLDGLKNINDSMGHDAGDEVLKEFARKFSANTRTEDVVARLGGDEFGIILNNIDSEDIAQTIAARLLKEVNSQFVYGNRSFPVGVSIGIVMYPSSECANVEEFIKQADAAMYQAKRSGKGQYKIYEHSKA